MMEFKTVNMDTLSKPEIVKLNASFARKLTFSRKKNIEKANAIRHYITDKGIKMPYKKAKKTEYFDELLDRETGEYQGDYEILLKTYFDISKSNGAIYAKFKNSGKESQQMMGCWHSLNKIDSIWNFRKANLIKKVWKKVLLDDKLHEKYDICHLTLTVPHKDGIWQGKRFYARELLAAFNIIRKDKELKEMIFGGEYGVEHTYSEKNGFHIHLHAMVFQHKHYSINKVREKISELWTKKTKGTIKRYEGLYVHMKDDSGRWIIETVPQKITGFDEITKQYTIREAYDIRKKFYLGNYYAWYRKLDDEQKVNAFCSGILECIKYHFKDDVFLNQDGSYNVDYMMEALNNSKGLRMYSKFGGFLGDKRLNYFKKNEAQKEEITEYRMSQAEFNEICTGMFSCGENEQIEITTISNDLLVRVKTITDIEENEKENEYDELKPDIDNAVKYLVNPFTMDIAKEGDYGRYISFIEKMTYTINPFKKETFQHVQDKRHYFRIRDSLKMKEVMKLLYKNQMRDLLEYRDYEKYLIYIKNKQYSSN